MGLLDDAVAVLDERGVLEPLGGLIRQVYRRAADRHEPDLGDDAMSFGTTVWRNLTNLGKAAFDGVNGVRVRVEDNSLEILCAGYVVRLYSLQGGIESIRWEGSEARLGGAVENSRDGQLAFDDDEQFPEVFAGVVPPKRHLRVAHTGDIGTGEATAYLGLPRDNREGGSPWFEVTLWFGDATTGTPLPVVAGPVGVPGQRHDELPVPELPLGTLRPAGGVGRTLGVVAGRRA
ncbi:hypothetical protein [Micromonospora carbonacea]|uniref:Uncharacterized protein n=1 Tax=Micromonospora carbonacea TaxID=47853 RepID=A0A7H8XEQ8_9ACTN|nr:hypothetical protein [Micromonospora carbonacea]MBB5829027.1 hypothetical protein [Micromonospora carbonacea]QLD23457.1 hypothetical protein HXZ27_03860 [Micromonospora carbonacea]